MKVSLRAALGPFLLTAALYTCGCGGKSSPEEGASASPTATASASATPSASASPGEGHQAKSPPSPWEVSLDAVQQSILKGDFEQARQDWPACFQEAKSDLAHQAEAKRRLGEIELGLGHLRPGVQALQDAAALSAHSPTPDYELQATSFLTIGAAYYTVGKYSAARQALTRSIAILEKHLPQDLQHRRQVLSCLLQVATAARDEKQSREIREQVRQLDLQMAEAVPPDHLASYWLGRKQSAGAGLVQRFLERRLPPDRVLAEARWLGRIYPTAAEASPTPSASPSNTPGDGHG